MQNHTLVVVDPDTLRDLIAATIRQSIAEAMPVPPAPEKPADDCLTRTEAARLLKISLVSLTSLVNRGTIPVHRLPGLRRPLFRRSDILAALEART